VVGVPNASSILAVIGYRPPEPSYPGKGGKKHSGELPSSLRRISIFEIAQRLGFPAWSGVDAMSFDRKYDLPIPEINQHIPPHG
jgi:hypothetical protein